MTYALRGGGLRDPAFTGGGHRVRYAVATGASQGPFTVEAELWYQPVAYRWATNLKSYSRMEPQRFVKYYEQQADSSAVMLARSVATSR